jgi:hypothetical protein
VLSPRWLAGSLVVVYIIKRKSEGVSGHTESPEMDSTPGFPGPSPTHPTLCHLGAPSQVPGWFPTLAKERLWSALSISVPPPATGLAATEDW